MLLACPALLALFLQGEATPPRIGLSAARARVQAIAIAGNGLGEFRPKVTPWDGEDPRPGIVRAVPGVGATSPWSADETLWMQVPEHCWTHLADAPEQKRRLFSGDDDRFLIEEWRTTPFPPRGQAHWQARADGALELASELESDMRVSFLVAPGDRFLELRFGVRNGSPAPLLDTSVQFCVLTKEFPSLVLSTPASVTVQVGGKLVDWGAFGQSLAWIERVRRPDTGKVAAACYLQALVDGFTDSTYDPEHLYRPGVLWLARKVDLGLIVKSSSDGKRQLVLYSPSAQQVMSNLIGPCTHADPAMARIEPGEERIGVLYAIYHQGDVGPLVQALVALDHELRDADGFAPE